MGGKGGVGKTTCAAALALASARHRRTLLISTDPASSLGDALDVRVSAAPRPVARARGLDAANVDAAKAFDRWIAPRRALLATIARRGTYLDDEDVGRLLNLSLPGIDEVVGLLEIARLAARGYEHVVIDTAPTGHTLRLLASPALLERVAELLDAVHAHHRAVVGALRGRYASDEADALIAEIDREGRALAARLRDPVQTTVAWVTLPEPMALEETSDAIAGLARDGIPVTTLIVNRMTPAPPESCTWCNARRRFEARALAPLSARFAGLEVHGVPQLDVEPRGVAALRRVAGAMRRWTPKPAPPPIAHRVRAASAAANTGASAFRRNEAWMALASPARWILFGGKGGVGKSTCAAAFALRLAARHPGRRVLLLSSDPAHSLGDVLGARFGDTPVAFPGAPANLLVREIDAAASLAGFRATYLDAVDEAFTRITRGAMGAGADHAAFRQLVALAPPGIDEVIAIADVAESLARSDARAIIVSDTAPTGHALRLLQTPGVLRDWTHALMATLLKYREIVGAGALADLLVRLSQRLRRLDSVLRDPTGTRFVIVTRAAALPRGESLRLKHALEGMGIAIGAVVVNAAGAGTCPRCRSQRQLQRREIESLLRALRGPRRRSRDARSGTRDPCAIIEAPAEVPPPHGAEALTAWTSSWRHIS